MSGTSYTALRFSGGTLWALDQTRLPAAEVELPLRSAEDVAGAIGRLAIRGAPLIGVAAAYGVALAAAGDPSDDALHHGCDTLISARPTAIDLAWAVGEVRARTLAVPVEDRARAALDCARDIEACQRSASAAIGRHGADLLAGRPRVLTHCNAGALAAPGRGTALAVIAEMASRGAVDEVLVDESRPLLQGARLTVLELARLGIPHRLIVDSAAHGLILKGSVGAVIVGCDRVAANGDVANKVGTVGLALAAAAAGIPFVVAGPVSTIDLACPDGSAIVIEERDEAEVTTFAGHLTTAPGTSCLNPAFDVTPAALVTAIVTERGAVAPVDPEGLRRIAAERSPQPAAAVASAR